MTARNDGTTVNITKFWQGIGLNPSGTTAMTMPHPYYEDIAWKVVYAGKQTLINYSIIPGDAIYYVAKQHLSEWHSGFGSAAVMMIMSLMAVSPLYESEDSHIDFTNFWLEDNRFLFGDVNSNNKRDVAIHICPADFHNSPQGCVLVSELNSKESVLQTALSLSAAVVKRALNLLVTKEMTFEIKKSTTSKGKKKPSCKGKVPAAEVKWTAVIAIVELAQQYMKATTHTGQLKTDGVTEDVQSEEFNEQYADLLAFH
ncbi:hypothetical protein DFH29DRAFT_874416 [Suillus ampliporus]|nr:hypothetical protein DFH29DRAFT_874416 [Suillus ampliporus]